MIKESADFSTFLENFDGNPFHKYLGLKVAEHRDGFGRLRLTVGSDTPTGIGGSVNGGVIATMIDMSSIVAVFAGIPAVFRVLVHRENIGADGPIPKPFGKEKHGFSPRWALPDGHFVRTEP